MADLVIESWRGDCISPDNKFMAQTTLFALLNSCPTPLSYRTGCINISKNNLKC